MKILILYSYNKGYLSSFFFELSERLVKEGHEVVNFCLKGASKEFSLHGVDLLIKKKGGYISNYRQIYSIIKHLRPDVVLSNFSYVNPALLFGKLFGVQRNVVWFHSLNEQMEASKLDIFIKKQFLKLADLVIANSYLTQNELQAIYKVPKDKLASIPFWSTVSESVAKEGISKYGKGLKVFKIGCPGRMAEHKNQRIVIEAVSKIRQNDHFNFQLYMAGNGEALAHLQLLTKELGLESHVSFLGHLSAEDMITFYTNMDVIVLPSLHEAFGLVFIEAISLGTPVIVSSRFGALTFIDTDKLSKFTFNPESSKYLAKKLIEYSRKEGMSSEDFKQLYSENFDKESIFKKFLSVCRII